MISRIQELFAESVAVLAGIRQALIRDIQNMTADWHNFFWKDLRKGVICDFILTLLSLVIITYFIWGFDYLHRLYDSVLLNLLAAALPATAFYEAMRREGELRRFSWGNVVLVFFLALMLGLALSEKFDLDALGINIFVIVTSSPWLFIFGKLVREKRILAIGMVPAAIILMAYWVAPSFSTDQALHYFLVPFIAVSMVTALWTVLVWIFFKGIDKWQCHLTLGPLMESLAMLLLFIPLMVLAILVPRTIPGGDDWSVVLAAMVGVVFGSVVSEPLGQFLRSYGNLPSHRRRFRCTCKREVHN